MIIPSRVAAHVLDGKRENDARMVVNTFGPPDNQCLLVMVNEGGMWYWGEAFLEAAKQFKARGDMDKHDAIKQFFEQLQKAVAGGAQIE